jgi:hypothetical protein
VIRKPLHKLLLVVIILWSALLVTCSFLWAFMGMMFAGEPAGGSIGAYELMLLAAPFVVTGVLSTVLIKLWQRGHYAWSLAGLLLSSVIIAINFYGYVL